MLPFGTTNFRLCRIEIELLPFRIIEAEPEVGSSQETVRYELVTLLLQDHWKGRSVSRFGVRGRNSRTGDQYRIP